MRRCGGCPRKNLETTDVLHLKMKSGSAGRAFAPECKHQSVTWQLREGITDIHGVFRAAWIDGIHGQVRSKAVKLHAHVKNTKPGVE